jgi:hypothetical protein
MFAKPWIKDNGKGALFRDHGNGAGDAGFRVGKPARFYLNTIRSGS